ncbi:MAG: DUF1028 domain-containing protein [Alphaproteobacteria bacterium]|nr:DUF1028 domain-containing protein [Alphaproteobacteria bacterium]
MTWSIVARDAPSGAFGVAVSTKFFAVGALSPHALSGVGALSTQALINPMYGPRGLRLLAEGVPAADVVRILTEADPGSPIRQVHAVDRTGRVAAHTGTGCIGWCGHRLGDGFSVAGNMLAGPQVVDRTFVTFAANAGKPLAERFMLALEAGEAAGGDKRGKQSAAMLIHSTEDYPDYDLRVDDHPEPLKELRRLLEMYEADFKMFREVLPTRARPAGIYDQAKIEEVRARRLGAGRPATTKP